MFIINTAVLLWFGMILKPTIIWMVYLTRLPQVKMILWWIYALSFFNVTINPIFNLKKKLLIDRCFKLGTEPWLAIPLKKILTDVTYNFIATYQSVWDKFFTNSSKCLPDKAYRMRNSSYMDALSFLNDTIYSCTCWRCKWIRFVKINQFQLIRNGHLL